MLLVHSTGGIGAMPAWFLAESYIETQQYAKDIHKVTSDSNHYTDMIDIQPYRERKASADEVTEVIMESIGVLLDQHKKTK